MFYHVIRTKNSFHAVVLDSLVLKNSNNNFRTFKTLVTMQYLFALLVLYTTSKQKHSRVQPINKVFVFLPWWFLEVSCQKLVQKHSDVSFIRFESVKKTS